MVYFIINWISNIKYCQSKYACLFLSAQRVPLGCVNSRPIYTDIVGVQYLAPLLNGDAAGRDPSRPLPYNRLTMNLGLFLALAGGVVVLAAAFGKRIFPSAASHWRLPLAILGIAILAVSLWLSLRKLPAGLPPASTPVGMAVQSFLPKAGRPPIILGIQTQKTETPVGLVIIAQIHFQDADGDAETAAFALDQTTAAGATLQPQPIDVSPQDQEKGASLTVEWDCQGSSDMFLFKTVILDRAGHRSNLVPLLLDCG